MHPGSARGVCSGDASLGTDLMLCFRVAVQSRVRLAGGCRSAGTPPPALCTLGCASRGAAGHVRHPASPPRQTASHSRCTDNQLFEPANIVRTSGIIMRSSVPLLLGSGSHGHKDSAHVTMQEDAPSVRGLFARGGLPVVVPGHHDEAEGLVPGTGRR